MLLVHHSAPKKCYLSEQAAVNSGDQAGAVDLVESSAIEVVPR
jgi:hypothetical protein